jgi:hypothetical protein
VRDFLNTAIDHARSTAAIIHLAEPIRSAEMVMLDPSTRTAMATKFGDDVPKRVEEANCSGRAFSAEAVFVQMCTCHLRIIRHLQFNLLSAVNEEQLVTLVGD